MKLTEIRKKRGLTQAELAEASNVSYRTIQEYEQGRSDLNKASVITVCQIAKALNCTVEDLIEL
jgi:transcriptional regulator with XRE-family HTH domain